MTGHRVIFLIKTFAVFIYLVFPAAGQRTGGQIYSAQQIYYKEKYTVIKKIHTTPGGIGFLLSPKKIAHHGWKALLNTAADKHTLHRNETIIFESVNDKSVSTELFAAMFITYFQPQEIFDKLISEKEKAFIQRVKEVIALEKKNRVSFMIHLLKSYLVRLRALKSRKEAISLGGQFNINTERLMSAKLGRHILNDLYLEALFSRDQKTLDMVSVYYKTGEEMLKNPDSPEIQYEVIRHYMYKSEFPKWMSKYEYKDTILRIIRELVVSSRNYVKNEQSVRMLSFLVSITGTKISREFMAENSVLIEKEYDKCISSLVYFAAQRGYIYLIKSLDLFHEPAKIYLRSVTDKKALVKMCLDASPLRYKNPAKIELDKIIIIGKP